MVMSNLPMTIGGCTVFPVLSVLFSVAPEFFLESEAFNTHYEQKPKVGVGSLIAKMWGSTKIIFLDDEYIMAEEPIGENLEIDQWTFVGLTLFSVTIRLLYMLLTILDPFNFVLEFSVGT